MLTAIKNNKSLSFYQNIAEPRQRKADSLPIAGMISPAMGGMTYSTVTYTHDVNQAFSDLVANVSRRGMQYANNTVASRGGYMAENFVADSYIILMLQLKGLMLQGQLFQKKMAFHPLIFSMVMNKPV